LPAEFFVSQLLLPQKLLRLVKLVLGEL